MLDVRMLFSALVDADFIETEIHFNPDRSPSSGKALLATEALDALVEYIRHLKLTSTATDHVLSMRDDLFNSCLSAAETPPGLFTLTAPTGTGKTFAMLAFALKHARMNGLRRIIVVLPYLSIIDQTVKAYRKAIPENILPVMEHHSLTSTKSKNEKHQEDGDEESHYAANWLAPNWEAPLIVTTSVQMLESLFANRPSACRKLHNLANSVILFDEVQSLPLSLAVPTLATLSRLSERFGASVVFSTATQPAFSSLDKEVKKLCAGGWQPKEIVPDELDLFKRARRTSVKWPEKEDVTLSWNELARRLIGNSQALCILNLKKHAFAVYDELQMLGADGLVHLSTNLCPAHRQHVLQEVRHRLDEGLPCLLVATQCVEAGVDLDFPVVYRAWGPLDAIAQAAGRCNRNGQLPISDVFIFRPESEGFPDKDYERAVDIVRMLGESIGWENMDIHSPEVFDRYYRMLYDFSQPEEQNRPLRDAIIERDFVKVAEKYRLIKNDAINVLVPYNLSEYERLRSEVKTRALNKSWIKQAQPYCISLYRPRYEHPAWSLLEPVPLIGGKRSDEWFIWLDKEGYDEVKGLVVPDGEQVLIS